MRLTASIALLSVLVLPGCGALLGVGAGVVISQDVLDSNVFVAQVQEDTEIVWAVAKSSLSHQAESPIDVNDDLRVAKGKVHGHDIEVSVETRDLNECRMKVSASQYGITNGEMAEMVMNRILKDLEQ
jgi:hypothetical protein